MGDDTRFMKVKWLGVVRTKHPEMSKNRIDRAEHFRGLGAWVSQSSSRSTVKDKESERTEEELWRVDAEGSLFT